MMAVLPQVEVLVPRDKLRHRIHELGEEIGQALAGRDPLLVGVLKGSAVFLADLCRALPVRAGFDFMAISAYAGGSSRGVVQIVKDLDQDITGRDVVIVEDIVDTGLTLNYLRRTLEERDPRSLSAVTLLDKSARRIIPVPVEWRGFEIPDVYVLGYGIDHEGLYRNVQDLVVAPDIKALAAHPDLYVPALFPGRNEA
jgi:hypoxanthine phosphoribosyltransferase